MRMLQNLKAKTSPFQEGEKANIKLARNFEALLSSVLRYFKCVESY